MSQTEIIDAAELAKRLTVTESWVRDQVRSRVADPIPCFHFGLIHQIRVGPPRPDRMAGAPAQRQDNTAPQGGRAPCAVASMCANICYMKRITIYLTAEQVKGLAKLSDKSGAPVAELVRRSIDQYLKAQGVR